MQKSHIFTIQPYLPTTHKIRHLSLHHYSRSIFNLSHIIHQKQQDMEKQPFDETGLQQLLTALYALPDPDLTEEAYALRNQPKLWINGHFELDHDQLEFLHQMPVAAANFLGQQGAFAIENRLPVSLIKSNQPKSSTEGQPKQDKLFKTNSSLSSTTDIEGTNTPGGELHLEVTYLDPS